MSPGQNVTQEVRAKRHPVGQGKMSQGNTSQGKTSPRAKRLRAECHPTFVLEGKVLLGVEAKYAQFDVWS